MLRVLSVACLALALCCSFATCYPALAQPADEGALCPSADALDAAPLSVRRGDSAAIASFRETAPCHHWITFYFAAEALFNAGDRDEAVHWFYVGQLRGRVAAALDNTGSTPAAISALQHIVGQPVNQYAGGDFPKWTRLLDQALEWDRLHPMERSSLTALGATMDFSGRGPLGLERLSVTQTQFDAAYAEQRRGLQGLRDTVAEFDPAEARRIRRQNGAE